MTKIVCGIHTKSKDFDWDNCDSIRIQTKWPDNQDFHIGSDHNKGELSLLLVLAHNQLLSNQLELFPEPQSSLHVGIKWSYVGLLWNILQEEYHKLGFDQLDDEVFEALCISRIVEATSKRDGLNVLDDLGEDPINLIKLYRCLVKAANQDYWKSISQASYKHVRNLGLNLVLYGGNTLYFQIQE